MRIKNDKNREEWRCNCLKLWWVVEAKVYELKGLVFLGMKNTAKRMLRCIPALDGFEATMHPKKRIIT